MIAKHLVVGVAIIVAMMTSACRQDDAKRPTSFTPGVYTGEAMPKLTAQQVEDLQKRGLLLR